MKSKLSKANRTIVRNTLERWVHTLTEGTPNIEKAKEYLRAGYKNGIGAVRYDRNKHQDVTFHVVKSPAALAIAATVVRGRMNKKSAAELCKTLSIDDGFLSALRRDNLSKWNSDTNKWWHANKNEFIRTWLRAIHEEYLTREHSAASTTGLNRRWWRGRTFNQSNAVELAYRSNDTSLVMPIIRSMMYDHYGLEGISQTSRGWDGRNVTSVTQKAELELRKVTNQVIWDSNTTLHASNSLRRAIDINDLMQTQEEDNGSVFLGTIPKAADAEILCRILKIDDPEMTWEHEVFHHCTAFVTFQKSCIVLADRPTVCLNDENNLHNAEGPAVSWSDGTRLWFNDGHQMDECGKRIVMEPHKLTTTQILQIRNEETRRLAIERFGWEKFIAEADCPVIDQRRNDVDNTVEMLVGPPRHGFDERSAVSVGPNRMVLFCRSTGRQYFLSVPRDVTSCAEAQAWMANSGSSPALSYAASPIRVVGAS